MIDLTDLLIDIEDQRRFNSCGGQAASTYLEAIWRKFDGGAKEFSPMFIWQLAKKEDGREGNAFTNGTTIFEVLKKYGCCLETSFPYTDENTRRDPPPEALKEAKKYRIKSFEVTTLHRRLREWLEKGLPVLVLLNMGGGHFVCVFGYDDQKGYLIVNSWGTGWMNQGTYWMPHSEFERIYQKGYAITGLRWGWLKAAKKWFKSAFA